tara:strand:+ start:466 stop:624 length:159 start_codon:yes stop_codon:yes gene_type:complete
MNDYSYEQLVEIVEELITMHRKLRDSKHLESCNQLAEMANDQIYKIENGEWQ